jgi:hypothetical protein
MKSFFITFFFILLSVFLFSDSNDFGSILLVCEQGFRVYIDDEFKGYTKAEEDGIFIDNVEVGEHIIVLKKRGYAPVRRKVQINPNEIFEKEFKYFTKVSGLGDELNKGNTNDKEIRLDGYYVSRKTSTTSHTLLGLTVAKTKKQINFYFAFDKKKMYFYFTAEQMKSKQDIISNAESFVDLNKYGLNIGSNTYGAAIGTYQIKSDKILYSQPGETGEIKIVDNETIRVVDKSYYFHYTGE